MNEPRIDFLDEGRTHFTQCDGCGRIFDRDGLVLYGGRCKQCGLADDDEPFVDSPQSAEIEPRAESRGHAATLRARLRAIQTR